MKPTPCLADRKQTLYGNFRLTGLKVAGQGPNNLNNAGWLKPGEYLF